jgi:hypothetical protein
MNRFFCTLALGLVALSVCLLAAGNAVATTVLAENFDTGINNWDGDGLAWNSTGGQGDNTGYLSGSRNGGPYLDPPDGAGALLIGDLPSKLGGNVINFSYYLKNISGTCTSGGKFAFFGGTDTTPGWDTQWIYTPSDTSVPTDWRQYTVTADMTASAAPAGWALGSTNDKGTHTWADSWKNVTCINFWSDPGAGGQSCTNGIDTVVVTVIPEPASVVLLITGLLGLLAYAWRRRR